ncbi:hypothetical protein PIB30_079255, partial [Stylosanthes scabra]|nr:hypothetical protein [Stylosanthes scabra]
GKVDVGALITSQSPFIPPTQAQNNLRSVWARRFSEMVVRVYLNGVPREGRDGVEFYSPDEVVFMMWPVETLSDLKKTVLRNMRLSERTPIIRMAYRFLTVLADRSCHHRVFWLNTTSMSGRCSQAMGGF